MRRLSFLLCLWSLSGWAGGSVYLNGVNVDGLTDQHFERVNVRLDAKGDVYIDAPGYNVQKVPADPSATTARPTATTVKENGTLSRRYLLVTEQSPPGLSEYDIDVFLNGKFLRTLRAGEEQIVSELTRKLRPGANEVTFQARKVLANPDQPRSHSKSHVFRVIIGEGTMTDDQVVIETQLIKFERTAADTNDLTQQFTLTTR